LQALVMLYPNISQCLHVQSSDGENEFGKESCSVRFSSLLRSKLI
jgi:hypothetical protein